MKIKDIFKLGKSQIDRVSGSAKKVVDEIGEVEITGEDVSSAGKSLGRKVGKTAAVTTAYALSVGAAATVLAPGLLPAMVGIIGAGATYKVLNRKQTNEKKLVNEAFPLSEKSAGDKLSNKKTGVDDG